MRILTLIFATLLLLAATGLGLLGTNRSIKDAKDIERLYQPMRAEIGAAAKSGDKSALELQSIGEKTGALRTGAAAFALAALASLVLLVMTYVNRRVGTGAIVLLVIALAAIVINPAYDLGKGGPASARSLAYVVAALAGRGAACAFGAAALRKRRTAA